MTKLQRIILKYIAKQLVVQSYTHMFNVIQYYDIIKEAAQDAFTENNRPTTNAFLTDCFNTSLNDDSKELHLNIPEKECFEWKQNTVKSDEHSP